MDHDGKVGALTGDRTPATQMKAAGPNHETMRAKTKTRWALWDSNPQPTDYEPAALTIELRA